jgi:hypothetical protein
MPLRRQPPSILNHRIAGPVLAQLRRRGMPEYSRRGGFLSGALRLGD